MQSAAAANVKIPRRFKIFMKLPFRHELHAAYVFCTSDSKPLPFGDSDDDARFPSNLH
jgi:hypothetical protein